MQVSLTPELEELVRRKVESGFYGDASEVIREALRLLAARDELDRLKSSWGGCVPGSPARGAGSPKTSPWTS